MKAKIYLTYVKKTRKNSLRILKKSSIPANKSPNGFSERILIKDCGKIESILLISKGNYLNS